MTAMKNTLIAELVDIYTNQAPAYVKARRWRFDASCAHCVVDTGGNFVASTALAAIFVETANLVVLAAWLVVINALSFFRLYISIVVPRLGDGARRRAELAFSAALVLHGLVWTMAFFLLAPEDSVAQRSAVIVWLAGSASWVVAAYTLLFEAVLGFLVLQIFPLAIYLLFVGDRFWQLVSVGCFLFLPTMAIIAIRNNAWLIRGQITQLEKEDLAEALVHEQQAVLELVGNLEADLNRREIIELDLREEKARAEALASELEKLSSLDGLTGIANRRRFDQTLEREWNRGARAQQSLALIMCDIDYFKQYNDRYGHQAGDACLRQLAQVLETSLKRGGDLAARYGGEEFAILLPDTGLENATMLAENVREHLQQLGLPHDASLVAPILTASFGVAAIVPTAEMSPSVLIRRADEAMYEAKARGRDRIVRATGEAGDGATLDTAHLH